MKVWQYAKICGMSSTDLINCLMDVGIYNKKAQSNITEEEIQRAKVALNTDEDTPEEIKQLEINSKDYYDVDSELIKLYPDAKYYIAISPRGVGKSTNGLLCILKEYLNTGSPSALLRRRAIELEGGKLAEIWNNIIGLGYIKSWSHGKWNSVHTIGMRCYLCKRDEDGKIVDKDKHWFLYAIPIAEGDNFKGIQLNKGDKLIKYILFDEMIPVNNDYIVSEGSKFFNTISSIIREFKVAKILLFGNTIVGSKNPILDYMGIDIYSFKVGEKRLYTYEEDGIQNSVAIHFIDKLQYGGVANKNNEYFIFNNAKLSSITGISDEYGVWELNKDFNALPRPYTKKDIKAKFYWITGDEIFQGDIIKLNNPKCIFIFNHKTNRKYPSNDGWLDEQREIIFSRIADPRPNWINKICNSKIKNVNKIYEIIKSGKVYYQNAWLSNYFESLIQDM